MTFKRIGRQRLAVAKETDDDGNVMRWVHWFDKYEQNQELYIRRPRTNHLTCFPTQEVRFWFVMKNTEGTSTAFDYEMKSREPRSYSKWADYIAADFPDVFEDAKLVLLTELRPYLVWRNYAFIGWTADAQLRNPYSAAEAFCCKGYSRIKKGFVWGKEID